MNLSKTIIETTNLILKPIALKYLDDIFREFTDKISLYMLPQPTQNIEDTLEFINTSLEGLKNGSNLQLVVLDKNTTEFIGCVGLHNLKEKDPELGLWIKKSAHGNGYGIEAMSELIHWAKNNIDFKYLRYPVDKRNLASRRIPEKNKGIIKREFKSKNFIGFELDEVEYWIYK